MTRGLILLGILALSVLALAGWLAFVRSTARGGPGTRSGEIARMVGAVWLCLALYMAILSAAIFAGLPDSALEAIQMAGLVGAVTVGVWLYRNRVMAAAAQARFPWMGIAVSVAAAGAAAFAVGHFQARREEAQIRAALDTQNAALPRRLDEITTIERIDYAPKTREILYLHRLDGVDPAWIAEFRTGLRDRLRDRICGEEALIALLDQKFRLVYRYAYGNEQVVEAGFGRADCDGPAPAAD